MKKLTIKNYVLGEGMPLICTPIMGENREQIVSQAKKMIEAGMQMIEWRVDAFCEADNLNAIREVLEELRPLFKNTILVYTFRSKSQGGLREFSKEMIYDIHQVGAESKVADFVDVEFFAAKNIGKEIAALQKMGTHVIASHHDFSETPAPEVMEMIFEQMKAVSPDVIKLAVMPQSTADVLALLTVTDAFHVNNPEQLMITMSMGAKGAISRLTGELFGSCVTFAAFEEASAPGQMAVKEEKMVMELLHRGL